MGLGSFGSVLTTPITSSHRRTTHLDKYACGATCAMSIVPMCRIRRRSPHVFFGTLKCTTLMGELSGRTGAGGVPPPTLGAPEARLPCARRPDLETLLSEGKHPQQRFSPVYLRRPSLCLPRSAPGQPGSLQGTARRLR